MRKDQNFKKHPHTARWMMTFHTAGHGLPADIEPASTTTGGAAVDLLDEIPATTAYRPTERQRQFMTDLLDDIATMDADAARTGSAYTLGMSEHGRWTPANVSTWIDRLITKRADLRSSQGTAPKVENTQVADGRYAVEEDGVLKFFKVTNGRKAGFVFLDVQASDDWHAIRNVTRIRQVLALIAADPHAAMVRYGHELGECGRCGRTLTDEASRAAGIGPICASK